jgi:hypothetical protein
MWHECDIRNASQILVAKREGGSPLERPNCRLEDDIKMDHKEIVLVDMDWIYHA